MKSLKVILIIIIVVLFVALGFFLIMQEKLFFKSQLATTSPRENPPAHSLVQEESNWWQTHTNEKIGFSFKYPAGWKIEDSLKVGAGYVNIFNSQDPYDGKWLKQEVMKAQIQYHLDTTLTNKEQYIEGVRKLCAEESEGSEDPICGAISRSLISTISNVNGLDIVKFGGSDSATYVIPIKANFSEVLYIIVWNLDPKIEEVLRTLNLSKKIALSNVPDVSAQPAYIIDTFSRNGKNYLELDYVEWFHGTSSIQAQIQDGSCPVVEECRSFPNGYKRNHNSELRTLEISPSASITSSGSLVYYLNKLEKEKFPNPDARGLPIDFHDLDLAVSIAEGLPYESPFREPKAFVLVDVNNGVVTKLVEPYQE